MSAFHRDSPVRAVALLVLAMLGVACDSMLTRPSLYNEVAVVATRRNGAPIDDVQLTLYTGQRPMGYGTTGPDGRFRFTRIPQGLYGVFATPPAGYVGLETLVAAPPSNFVQGLPVASDTLGPVHFTFLKRGPGTVMVHLADATSGDVGSAPVTLYSPAAVVAKSVTDASGRATFTNVPFGVYGISVDRPLLYRDYRGLNDSLYSFQDNIIVDEGAADTATIRMQRCAGTLRAAVVDDAGAAVANAGITLYTAFQQLAISSSSSAGIVAFTGAPCVQQMGMSIVPPAGYLVDPGRGQQFFDGLTVTNGATTAVTFRLHKR